MRPFIPLPPRTIDIGTSEIAAAVSTVGFVIAAIGILMGAMA